MRVSSFWVWSFHLSTKRQIEETLIPIEECFDGREGDTVVDDLQKTLLLEAPSDLLTKSRSLALNLVVEIREIERLELHNGCSKSA